MIGALMGKPEWKTVRAVMNSVLDAAPQDRPSLLERLCAGDEELHAEVRSLLRSAETLDEHHGGVALGERAGDRIDNYELVEKLGEGGFGVVWRARQAVPVAREVALKIIKVGMDTAQVVARFGQERQALAVMDHPCIARVFDAGATPSGRGYFVMELVEGEPITRHCARRGLGLAERLRLFAMVCEGVQHAHQKGVIHRDLKPGNVLVAGGGGPGEGVDAPARTDSGSIGAAVPKIIDFGIAKATGGRGPGITALTEVSQFIGTPQYMAPEQALGGTDVDTRADVYSLGVLLYELITGVTPFDGERLRGAALDEVRRILREEDPPRPSTRLSATSPRPDFAGPEANAGQGIPPTLTLAQVRGDLDWIVMRAMEKDRARRYASPGEIAADLARHLAGEPVLAAPPSAVYRFRKLVRRNRVAVGAGASVTLALVVGLLASTYGLVRASEERDAAIKSQQRESTARDLADRAVRRHRAADGFMKEVLSSAYPSGLTGRPITVREVLRIAAVRIDNGSLRDEPEVEGAVRHSLAQSFRWIGEKEEAERNAQRALDLSGPDAHATTDQGTTETAAALIELSQLRSDRGDHGQALALAARAVAIYRRLGLDRSPEFIGALQALANARYLDTDHGDAAALLHEATTLAESLYGPRSAQAAEARGHAASRTHTRENLEEDLRRVVADYREALGPFHPSVADALVQLGIHLQMARRYDEAEKAYEEAFILYERTLGPESPWTIITHDFFAWIAESRGDFATAVKRRQRGVELAERGYGPEAPRTGHAYNGLGVAAQNLGDHALSLRAFEQALQVFGSAEPRVEGEYSQAQMNLAMQLWRMDDFAAAERLARVVATASGDGPANALAIRGRAVLMLGESALARGDLQAAEPDLLTGYAMIDASRALSNRSATLFLAARSVHRLYSRWVETDPTPDRLAAEKRWRDTVVILRERLPPGSSALLYAAELDPSLDGDAAPEHP
ncbi:MAG: protein kinase domain-containing protein [Phycisphaerales bacterium]